MIQITPQSTVGTETDTIVFWVNGENYTSNSQRIMDTVEELLINSDDKCNVVFENIVISRMCIDEHDDYSMSKIYHTYENAVIIEPQIRIEPHLQTFHISKLCYEHFKNLIYYDRSMKNPDFFEFVDKMKCDKQPVIKYSGSYPPHDLV